MNKRLLHAAHTVLTEPVEAEGTEIELRDTVKAPLKGLQVYGKSTQRTTKGTNLCNFRNYSTQTSNGVTFTADEYGVITLSGTPTVESGIITTYIHNGIDMSLLELGKTYYSNISIQIHHEDHKSWCTSFVFDESMVSVRPYIQPNVKDYIDGKIIKPVLSEGSLAEWEPFTGGAPSPSPEYPQEIVSVGDVGSIEVNISVDRGQGIKSAVLETPTGLPGIPVSSGGNYTDADGQQWVCDEVDFERGVYVQRIGILYGNDFKWNDPTNRFTATRNDVNKRFFETEQYAVVLCNIAVFSNTSKENTCRPGNKTNAHIQIIYAPKDTDMSNVIYMYQCEPKEIPLSAAELAAYKSLHSNYPTTIITNSEDAHMKVNCLKIRGGGV